MTVHLAHAGNMDYAHGQLWQWDNEGIQQMFFDTLSRPVISEQQYNSLYSHPQFMSTQILYIPL